MQPPPRGAHARSFSSHERPLLSAARYHRFLGRRGPRTAAKLAWATASPAHFRAPERSLNCICPCLTPPPPAGRPRRLHLLPRRREDAVGPAAGSVSAHAALHRRSPLGTPLPVRRRLLKRSHRSRQPAPPLPRRSADMRLHTICLRPAHQLRAKSAASCPPTSVHLCADSRPRPAHFSPVPSARPPSAARPSSSPAART